MALQIQTLDKTLSYGIVVASFISGVLAYSANMSDGATVSSVSYMGYVSIILGVIMSIIVPALAIAAVRRAWAVMPLIVLLHVGMGMFLYYYLSIYNPFTPVWALLTILSFMYFGRRGFYASLAYFVFISICCLVSYSLPNLSDSTMQIYAGASIFLMAIVVGVTYAFVRVLESISAKNVMLEKAKESEALHVNRLNTLLNSLSDSVLTLNRYGRVSSENAAALSLFDTNQSLVGKRIDELLEVKDSAMQPVSIRKMAEATKTSEYRDDLSMILPDETQLRLGVQVSRIHGNFQDNSDGYILIIRDITRQKTLEDEKDEFISVASHELRTPIAIAEGSLSNLVVMQEKGVAKELLTSAAQMAHDQILYLARMINDLSTLSRAERGVGDEAEEINVTQLMHDLYNRYEAEALEKSLQLNLDVDADLPVIETSRLYLEGTLQNFITNAIKYTQKGSVTLRAKLVDGKIQCSVSDTGIGLSKSDQKKVFEKFFRSEDYRTRETSGTGLGLYVVRKLADKLDTQIEVESRLNHGSTFSFVLPHKSSKLGTGKRTSAV